LLDSILLGKHILSEFGRNNLYFDVYLNLHVYTEENIMRITILDGCPSESKNSFSGYIEELANGLKNEGHEVTLFDLKKLDYGPCIGCFDCWLKTPGLCRFNDDAASICRSYISSDIVIAASPLIGGFPSALLKNAMDRLIPLVHPHLESIDTEVHHKKRYDSYPDISLLLEKEEFTDAEDISIISDIFKRLSINVRANMAFLKTTDSPIEEVINEINSI